MTSLLDPSSRSLVFAVFSVFVVICLMLCVITGADEDDRALVRSDSRRLRSWQQGIAMGGDTTTVATVTVLVGMVATTGFDGLGVMLGSLVGVLLFLVLVVEPLRAHASLTAPDLLDARGSGGSAVRAAWGVVTLLVCFPLLVVQVVVVGNVAAALLGQPGARTGCIVVIGCVMTALAVSGGIRGTGVVMIAKSAIALPVLVVAAVLVLHRFDGDLGRLLDAAALGSGAGEAFLRPGGYTGDGWVGAVNRIGQIFGMTMATIAMPAVLMRAIATKSPRGARTVGRWMLAELVLLYGALAVVGVGAAALVGGALREAGPSAQVFTPLLLGRALDGGDLLVAALACVLFLTALAAVVDVTLAAGITLGRDVLAASGRRAGRAARRHRVALVGRADRAGRRGRGRRLRRLEPGRRLHALARPLRRRPRACPAVRPVLARVHGSRRAVVPVGSDGGERDRARGVAVRVGHADVDPAGARLPAVGRDDPGCGDGAGRVPAGLAGQRHGPAPDGRGGGPSGVVRSRAVGR